MNAAFSIPLLYNIGRNDGERRDEEFLICQCSVKYLAYYSNVRHPSGKPKSPDDFA